MGLGHGLCGWVVSQLIICCKVKIYIWCFSQIPKFVNSKCGEGVVGGIPANTETHSNVHFKFVTTFVNLLKIIKQIIFKTNIQLEKMIMRFVKSCNIDRYNL